MNRQDLIIWSAGLVDGEGTITIKHGKNYRGCCPSFSVDMTHEDTIKRLDSTFPMIGAIYPQTNKKQGYKLSWKYVADGYNAIMICNHLLPWLITKRLQAELVIQYWSACGIGERGVHIPDSIMEKRIAYVKQMRKLNGYGTEE